MRWVALVPLAVLLGCSTPVVDVTPGPPEPNAVTVVEVTAHGSGGRVELVKANRRARAPSLGLTADDRAFQAWRQDRLDQGLFTQYADLEPGQTASHLVYHDWVPDEPMTLDVRFNGVSYWKGPVGTRYGGPNHVKLFFRDGKLAGKTVETAPGILTEGALGGAAWRPPADHVSFQLGKIRPDLNPKPLPR